MFTSKEELIRRTGKDCLGRKDFLQQLVKEFKESKSYDARKQVFANLANFAYDPVNYEYLRQHHVIDLFLDQLSESDATFTRFALGGLCNLALDKENKDYIIHCSGVKAVESCLASDDEEALLSAITTLMFLYDPDSKLEITSPHVIEKMLAFSHSLNTRLRNLATVFLEDYCSKEQIDAVKNNQGNSTNI